MGLDLALFSPGMLAACAGIALLSGSVHGYSGFGGALMMVPLLSFFIAPVHAVAVTMLAALVGQVRLVYGAVPIAEWAQCGPFLATSLLASPVGSLLLMSGDAALVRRGVGMTTLVAAALLATGWAYKGARTLLTGALFGGLAGLVNGATGQGGPVSVAYFIAAPTGAVRQRANIIVTVGGLVIGTLAALAAGGILTWSVLALGLGLGLPYMAGIAIGSGLFRLLPQQAYRRATLGLLFLAGLAALLR
jgi:uncharacterized membrane protein YfcA